jgi:tocopherol O-methyltransferase
MNISSSIIADVKSTADVDAIRRHYDSLSMWYLLFWGDHLHHGWFSTGKEKAREAQIEMLRQCASMVRVRLAARVLDVGCGYGGTSIFLASELACQVDGLSLSLNQLAAATKKAAAAKVRSNVRFHLQDAERFEYPNDHYDLVWTMESSEHFADKQRYFRQVCRTLRSDGRLLLAAWTGSMARDSVRSVAKHFLCPEICTADEYVEFIEAAGMQVQKLVNATSQVVPTWQICLRRIERFRLLRHLVSDDVRSFGDGLEVILNAYLSGQLTYTIITACPR